MRKVAANTYLYFQDIKTVQAVEPLPHVRQGLYKSHNASDKYLTIYHFVTEMYTHVHISVTK